MRHMLAIDDNLAALRLYARWFALPHLGIQVSMATSAEAALCLLEKMPPFDVVVCDLLLPGLDGLTFVDACADLQPGLPIILITGFADAGLHLTAAQKGVYALLHKPMSMAGLLAVVNRACLYSAYPYTLWSRPVRSDAAEVRTFQ
jgi:DNA-binding NtrC family response regulator